MSFLNMPLKLLYLLYIKRYSRFDISQFCFFLSFFPLFISAGILRHLAVEKEVTPHGSFSNLVYSLNVVSNSYCHICRNSDSFWFTRYIYIYIYKCGISPFGFLVFALESQIFS